jgi:hypothetical protein
MISKNKIKYIRSLELKKNRNKEGKFVAEGFKVVDDLLALQPADLIVATGEWLRGKHFGAETEVIEVTDEELKKVSFLQHPQQVLAVFKQATSGDYSINTSELSLALDGVQDPGNLAQGIINAAKNIVHTSSTASNMANNFQETVKIYKQMSERIRRPKLTPRSTLVCRPPVV